MNLPVETKIALLKGLEAVFDDFAAAEFQVACTKECAACCTHDVTATTIEAYRLRESLKAQGRRDLLARLPGASKLNLFRPRLTTNTLARAVMAHQEPPEEGPGPNPGPCPLLEGDLCSIYEDRPFSCRGMFSLYRCQQGREAEVSPGLVAVVTVSWQLIEHLDAGGLVGNLIDLVLVLMDDRQDLAYSTGDRLEVRGLPPSRPIPGFPVEPDLVEMVNRYLDQLFRTELDGRTWRDWLAMARET